ncbi:MAG: hypothetical protein HKP30_15225, partial [Myxococcales bacterium]|nr:hypothetical protein [Myxococcales bacterium]
MTRSRPTPKRSLLGLVCLAAASTALLGVDCSGVKQRMYEGSDRDAWQQPERVVAELGIGPGDRV